MKTRRPLPPPPDFPDDERSAWKVLKPLVTLLCMGAVLFFIFRFYIGGITEGAREEEVIQSGLRAVAQDVWLTGNAPEITAPDVKLEAALKLIKARLTTTPQILVVSSEPGDPDPRVTHQILYSSGPKPILQVQLRFNRDTQRIEIISFSLAPEYHDIAKEVDAMPVPGQPADDSLPGGVPRLPEGYTEDAPLPSISLPEDGGLPAGEPVPEPLTEPMPEASPEPEKIPEVP